MEKIFTCDDCGAETTNRGSGTVNTCDNCGSGNIEHTANLQTLRAKWMWDDSESIAEIIEKTEDKLEELQELKEEGWEVNDAPVTDDYAYLRKPV